ncbi:hypothetical protein AB0J86_17765 [Micromonospora sp. NPDC049559]|uniref:hypothetical protein n=1 Tax=Micromonospora sp. NPDC049559 TaxID=3155923 RepID=UPI00344058EA
MIKSRRLGWSVAAGLAIVLVSAGTAQAHHRTGTEPDRPYAQPATAPTRGCATVAATPSAPPAASIPAIQVIYAWHDGDGNHYEESVEQIARIVDRIDWALDESSNYDQHLNLSCRYTPNGTYADYARALVQAEKIEAGTTSFTSSATVRADLNGAGYADSNRYYLVFTDFESESDSNLCPTTGGYCYSVVEVWDSGVAGHELAHNLGAGHAWMTEAGQQYVPDIMMGWEWYWLFDPGFRQYYDPSELTASFYIDPYPSTTRANIATHPALTVPTCCDSGANSDLLTAQERTVEATAPGAAATGFGVTGGATAGVTAACGVSGVSCKYFDGRRSLRVTTSASAASGTVITRRPDVTAGQTYKYLVRLRADTAGTVRLRLNWYNSANTLVSSSQSADIGVTTNWLEWRLTAAAPAGATRVEAAVIAPVQTSFTFNADSFQLNHCNPNCRMDT